jgi:hypothetical protein
MHAAWNEIEHGQEYDEAIKSQTYHAVANVVHDTRDEGLAAGLCGYGTRVFCREMNWLRRKSGRQIVPLCQRLGPGHSGGGGDGSGSSGVRPRSPVRALATVTAVAATSRVCNTGAQNESIRKAR